MQSQDDSHRPVAATDGGPRRTVSRRAFIGSAGALIALTGCTARSSAPATVPSSTVRTRVDAPALPARAQATQTPQVHGSLSASPSEPPGPAREVMRGTGTRPEVALTFHGAGDPALAKSILTTASSSGAAVTVMAVGNWITSNPQIVHQINGSGHELGNHTWSHPVLRDLGRVQVRREIERCRDALEHLTGSPGRWFRQSGSQHSTPLIRELAGVAGYPVCLSYDVDSLDWTDPGPAEIVRNLGVANAGSIVSLHLGHPGTLQALPLILRALKARGLRAVTVTELLAT